jgi:quercetin dioxygenase-like cupin family protein
VERWDIKALNTSHRTGPRVLFSTPQVRAVLIDLALGEEMGDHQVSERAVVQVVLGSVALTSEDIETTCGDGVVVVFEPGERHAIRALEQSRLLLTLAPWPGVDRNDDAGEDPHKLPVNATEPQLARVLRS